MKEAIKIMLAAIILTFIVALIMTIAQARAASVGLAWDASPSTNSGTISYRIYDGVASRAYTNVMEAGTNLHFTVTGLVETVTYFFAVTAYDTNGLESDFSNEVSWQGPRRPPPPLAPCLAN